MAMPRLPERLDVEDDDERESRIKNLLQKTNSTASNNSPGIRPGPSPSSSSPSPSTFDFGIRGTHAVQPPTDLLERLQTFLPQMEAANAELLRKAQQAPESVDIEHLGPSETGQYIEMNLGLGVFDMHKGRTASEGARVDSSSASSNSTSSSEDDASDSDNDSDSSDSDDATGHLLDQLKDPANASPGKRPIKPLPNRSRPTIVVLSEHDSVSAATT